MPAPFPSLSGLAVAGCLLIASLPRATRALAPFPGSSALEFGYNILEGNPLSASADPGWRTEPIFDVNCASCMSNVTVGGFAVQNGVEVTVINDCSYSESAVVLHDAVSFQQASSSRVTRTKGFDIILAALEFSSSTYAQKVEKITMGGKAVLSVAAGRCGAYRVAYDPSAFAFPLAPGFEAGLAALPATLNASTAPAFQKFVDTFGTHVASQLDLGAATSQESLFGGANFSLVQSDTEDVAIAAKASLLVFFGVDLHIGGGYSFQDYLTFALSSSSNQTLCKPACPPSSAEAGVDPSIWRSTLGYPTAASPSLTAPVPVAASLVPLPTIIASAAVPAALRAGRITPQRAALLTAASANLLAYMNSSLCPATPGCGVPPTVPAQQTYAAALPTPLVGSAAATVSVGGSDALLVIGGAASDSPFAGASDTVSALDLGDPSSGWVTRPQAPEALAFAASAVAPVNGSAADVVVVTGGLTGAPPLAASNRTWALSPVSGTWTAGAQLAEWRFLSTAVVFDGVVAVMGGVNASGAPMVSVECLVVDGSAAPVRAACPASVPGSALPRPLAAASAAVLPSPYTPGAVMLLVSGGCQAGPTLGHACTAPSDAVWYVESGTAASAWAAIAPMPAPRFGHALLVDTSGPVPAVVIAGGFESSDDAAPATALFRASLDVVAWQSFDWPDAWPTAFAALAPLPASASPAAAASLRIGGLNTTGPAGAGTVATAARITAFVGGLAAGASA